MATTRPLRGILASSASRAVAPGLARATLACTALAAVSFIAVPSGLGYDPWAWLVWGRELVHLHLSTAGGPAFKPLPVALAALASPLGSAVVPIWLVAARAAALMCLVVAFRVGNQTAGRAVGALSAAALALPLLTVLWATMEGYAEPLLILLLLLAIDRHLSRHPAHAVMLGTLVALGRPEVWPLVGGYAVLNWRALGRWRLALLAVLAVVPAAWLLPGLLVSGGKDAAGLAANHHHRLTLLTQTLSLLSVPGLASVSVAAVLAVRRRDPLVIALLVAAICWLAAVLVLEHPDARYVMFPVSLLCLPAAVGAAWAVRAVRTRRARTILLACGVAALPFPLAAAWAGARDQPRFAAQMASLHAAVAAAGGTAKLREGAPVAINPIFQPALAWQLGLPLSSVRMAARRVSTPSGLEGWHRVAWTAPVTLFATPQTGATGPPPILKRPGVKVVAHTGQWTVATALPIRHPDAARTRPAGR